MLRLTSFELGVVTQYKASSCSRRWEIKDLKASNRCLWADKPARETPSQSVERVFLGGDVVIYSRNSRTLKGAAGTPRG